MTETDDLAPPLPSAAEIEFGHESCTLLTHEARVSADADMAIIRIKGKGPSAIYLGTTAARAGRLGAAMVRAGLRLDPSLTMQALNDAIDAEKPRGLRAVSDGAAS